MGSRKPRVSPHCPQSLGQPCVYLEFSWRPLVQEERLATWAEEGGSEESFWELEIAAWGLWRGICHHQQGSNLMNMVRRSLRGFGWESLTSPSSLVQERSVPARAGGPARCHQSAYHHHWRGSHRRTQHWCSQRHHPLHHWGMGPRSLLLLRTCLPSPILEPHSLSPWGQGLVKIVENCSASLEMPALHSSFLPDWKEFSDQGKSGGTPSVCLQTRGGVCKDPGHIWEAERSIHWTAKKDLCHWG